jgi:hypothetical protein
MVASIVGMTTHDIGSSITISDEQAASIAEIDSKLAFIHRDLGAHREQFIAVEGQLLQALSEVRTSLQSVVNEIGKSSGIDIESGEKWRFDPPTKSFVRTA